MTLSDDVLAAAIRAFGDTEIVGGPPSFTHRAIANAARAALEAARWGEPAWQPIETAPRDGDEFLAYGDDLGWRVVDYDPAEEGSEWIWNVIDGATYHKDAFTHWKPLGDPPRALLSSIGTQP